MRIGLLGDIHGNSEALSAVLSSAKKLQVDHLLVTGDLVGYYFSPARVLELLKPWNKDVVRGNHENMLAQCRNDHIALGDVTSRYGSGIRLALEQLNESQVLELCSLPHPLNLNFNGFKVLLCHGSPWDVNRYVYPDADEALLSQCGMHGVDAVVMGHTHYPMYKQANGVQLVNPGSVGQPRNHQPGAQWALLDTITKQVEFKIESYDIDSLIQECRDRHPELLYLSEVLGRGR